MKITIIFFMIFLMSILVLSCRTENTVTETYTDVSEFAYVNSVMKIISPQFGDLWEPGTTHTIQWFVTQDVKKVDIHLFKKNEFRFTIDKGLTGSTYEWTVPKDILTSHHYRIRVTNSEDSEQYIISKDFFILE